ncbi:trans-sulfuration enzyme family protein [Lentisalinibacter salinarum]|uniref:trans-sulfuration enzyme family protein n=1 Tax=Lentisalinibacter salinarum TaxID=2992239 RepID=UPI00386EFE7D
MSDGHDHSERDRLLHLETLGIHAGREPDPATGAAVTGWQPATTFRRGNPAGLSYIRDDSPNRLQAEAALAALEGGDAAVAFASGSAASFAVFSALPEGSEIVCTEDAYWGTRQQLTELAPRWGIVTRFVDTSDLQSLRAAITGRTEVVWLETPSNPLLRVSDVRAIAESAHAAGALLACDNTLATPVLQQPLALGADLVMHSTTKYLGGHSDLMGGVVIGRHGPVMEAVRRHQRVAGASPSPFDCWLLLRSLATLAVRVRGQSAGALRIAEALADHEAVSGVLYPGLPQHPGHALAVRQSLADAEPGSPLPLGAMLSIRMAGGAEQAKAVAGRTRLFTQATSLGGVESLIEHRAPVEGPGTLTPDDLLRLSVGLEHPDDLLADLERAISA